MSALVVDDPGNPGFSHCSGAAYNGLPIGSDSVPELLESSLDNVSFSTACVETRKIGLGADVKGRGAVDFRNGLVVDVDVDVNVGDVLDVEKEDLEKEELDNDIDIEGPRP